MEARETLPQRQAHREGASPPKLKSHGQDTSITFQKFHIHATSALSAQLRIHVCTVGAHNHGQRSELQLSVHGGEGGGLPWAMERVCTRKYGVGLPQGHRGAGSIMLVLVHKPAALHKRKHLWLGQRSHLIRLGTPLLGGPKMVHLAMREATKKQTLALTAIARA